MRKIHAEHCSYHLEFITAPSLNRYQAIKKERKKVPGRAEKTPRGMRKVS